MASTEEQIGKDTKAIENSLWKGAGNPFRKRTADEPTKSTPVQSPRPENRGRSGGGNSSSAGNEWDSLPEEKKLSKALVAHFYDEKQFPKEWAYKFVKEHPEYTDIELDLRSDAHDAYIKGLNKVWWGSAARDWNLELLRGGNAGHMFKPSQGETYKFDPDMAASVQSRFR